MQGKTIVITGATSGLGQVAAITLAGMGARIRLVARDPERAEATLARLRDAGPAGDHRAYFADLALIWDAKRVAAEIAATETRIDVLVNNAGALFAKRALTKEGVERTFALNHMSYFVLTEGLRGNLAPDARIVSTASNAHRVGRLAIEAFPALEGPGAFRTYGDSKLCNILFTRELARRLAGTGITANCFHPGFVATNFAGEAGGFLLPTLTRFAMALAAITPEEGAKTLIHLASSPAVAGITGEYFYRSEPATPSPQALDDGAAARLWALSETLAARSA